MNTCWILAAWVGLTATAPHRDDPEDLARVLAQRGWFDLAEEVCQGLPEPLSLLVRAEILREKADWEEDSEQAVRLLGESGRLLSSFLASQPRHLQGRLLLGSIQTLRAGRLRDAGAWEEAERCYRSLVADFQNESSPSEEISNAVLEARLELCRAMLERGRLLKERGRLLQEAIRLLDDFAFDQDGRPIAYEAMLMAGQGLLELGKFKEAETRLGAVLALKKQLKEAGIPPNDYHREILHVATVFLCRTMVQAGNPTAAAKLIDDALDASPEIVRKPAGLALKLEKMDALLAMRNEPGAMALAWDVVKLDPNGPFGARAREKMGILSRPSAAQCLLLGESYVNEGRYRDALSFFRRCLDACPGGAEKGRVHPEAFFKMGLCLQALKRNYEAAVAFRNVFELFPGHPLAPRACAEAVRCYAVEFSTSGDLRDDAAYGQLLERLVATWPDGNARFLQAYRVESAGDFRKAAEIYLQVEETAERYEDALVRAGGCFFKAGEARRAEEPLRKFLARPGGGPGRSRIEFAACDRLARVYLSEAVNRPEECLRLLEGYAPRLSADDDRLGQIREHQIKAHLRCQQVDAAVQLLDRMLERSEDDAAVGRACKSVAVQLDEESEAFIRGNGDPAAVLEKMKKASRYYSKWMSGISAARDIRPVADALYRIALRVNGSDGKAASDRRCWEDAAYAYALLAGEKGAGMSEENRVDAMTRRAQCRGFMAVSLKDWENARQCYDELFRSFKVIKDDGMIDRSVMEAHPLLAAAYAESGLVCHELGRKGQVLQFDNAFTVFRNLLSQDIVSKGTESWWRAKYMVIAILFERGGEGVKLAELSLKNLEYGNPDFDGGKFGYKQKMLDLRKKITQVLGR